MGCALLCPALLRSLRLSPEGSLYWTKLSQANCVAARPFAHQIPAAGTASRKIKLKRDRQRIKFPWNFWICPKSGKIIQFLKSGMYPDGSEETKSQCLDPINKNYLKIWVYKSKKTTIQYRENIQSKGN